jgi:hypothetical protein
MAHIGCRERVGQLACRCIAVGELTPAAVGTLGLNQLSATSGTRNTDEQDVRTRWEFEVGPVPGSHSAADARWAQSPTGVQTMVARNERQNVTSIPAIVGSLGQALRQLGPERKPFALNGLLIGGLIHPPQINRPERSTRPSLSPWSADQVTNRIVRPIAQPPERLSVGTASAGHTR